MSSLIGQTLSGSYEVLELLGKGGMATVYKAYQSSIKRYVAIKVLPPHPGLDDQFLKRFELEAQTIGGLQHPHILPLYDYGVQDDILYLVMAYSSGGSLEDMIREGKLSLARSERILREIGSALDYAHRKGIVHRDIKPGNILLDGEGHALLADFGIVKMTEGGANLTGTAVVGTPAYMAPEQAQGMEVDGRADIYALGVVLFEMLSGRQPFQADTPMQLIIKHMNEPVPDIRDMQPELPIGVSEVLNRVLTKDPEYRYQTATEFSESFSDAIHATGHFSASKFDMPLPKAEVNNQQGSLNNTSSPQTIIMREGPNSILLIGAFGLIALVILVIAMMFISSQNNNQNPIVDRNPTSTVLAVKLPEHVVKVGESLASIAALYGISENDLKALNNLDGDSVEAGQSLFLPEGSSQIVLASTAIPTGVPLQTFGGLRYTTSNVQGDTLNLSFNEISRPVSGHTYTAWLYNTVSGIFIRIGDVVPDAFGSAVVSYTDAESRILPAEFNALLITEDETATESPDLEKVVYYGLVPVEVTTSLHSILVADEQGINGGSLLDGAQVETNFAVKHAGLASNSSNINGMKSHAEHTINILNGTKEDYNGDGTGQNPGKGIGIFFFLDLIEKHVQNAINAENSMDSVQANAEFMTVCIENARNWADDTLGFEGGIISSQEFEEAQVHAKKADVSSSHLQDGFDANDNGIIEPFEGECSLPQIPQYAIVLGNMVIEEGKLP
ncbi:hypothetical protein MASR2M15_22810 [Anaerolineales bacterium]